MYYKVYLLILMMMVPLWWDFEQHGLVKGAGELELYDLLGPSNPNYSMNSSICISVEKSR